MNKPLTNQREFYDSQYSSNEYAKDKEDRKEITELKEFIEKYNLKNKKVLEIGCGRGTFQNLVEDWTGTDLSCSIKKYIKKTFVAAEAENLPFKDESFDVIWSITTLEHVNEPEKVLKEICRVLKLGGLAYLAPAWHVRSWASNGYEVRPWSDFNLQGKLIKALIPIRNNLLFRSIPALIVRFIRELQLLISKKPIKLHYKNLKPNYERYWCTDSDATCSMDPHEMLLWFKSRGWEIQSHPDFLKRFFVRHGAIIVQKL